MSIFDWKHSNEFSEWGSDINKYGDYFISPNQILSLAHGIEERYEKIVVLLNDRIETDLQLVSCLDEQNLSVLDEMIGDGFSKLNYQEIDEDTLQDLIQNFGSYLGVFIIKNLGGDWRFRDNFIHHSIYFGSQNIECFPFHRLSKRLLDGRDLALENFYNEVLMKLEV